MASIPPGVCRPLQELVESRLALVLDSHRQADLTRVVGDLKTLGEISSEQDLTNRLSEFSTKHPLWQQVIRAITIGETYFFRDRCQINALWESVIPTLINDRRKSGHKVLRIWSAGCSTGEEPYTLAILLRDLISDIDTWNITILATDLNMANLERAQQGLYRSWSFRSEMPEGYQSHWFQEEGSGYRIDPTIKSMVTFAPLNLAGASYPASNTQTLNIDLILCRNVLIYFDNPTINATIKRFHGALNENGWLVLGHSESAHMATHPFDVVNFEGAVLYRKLPSFQQMPPKTTDTIDELPVSTPRLISPQIKAVSATSTNPQIRNSTQTIRVVKHEEADPWILAYRAANKEDWEQARQYLADAEVKHKLRPEVHYLRGIVDLQQGDMDNALHSLRRAIYCKHDFVLAYFTIGEIFEKQGHIKKAINQWKQAHDLLVRLPQGDLVESSDNLTVEMLITVLEYRIETLTAKLIRHD